MKRIGVDVGGTFTDLYFSDDDQRIAVVEKVPSTPHDPSEAVINGIIKLCAKAGVSLSEIDQLVHGTTVATNTALTHTGAEVGMITTEGFRDILHIARHKKPYNFSLQQDLPWQTKPLIKRRHRLTVKERITAPNGEVLVPLDEDEVRERVHELKAAGVEAIAVCLLHSYLNPAHEQRIGEIVAEEFPEAYLSLSSEIVPLYREYERFSTTALNAYVGPRVSRYLYRLQEQARRIGLQAGDPADAVLRRHGPDQGGRQAARHTDDVRTGRRPDRRHVGRSSVRLRERGHSGHWGDLSGHRCGLPG